MLALPLVALASACSTDKDDDAARKSPAPTASPTSDSEKKATVEAERIGAVPPAELRRAALNGKSNGFQWKEVPESEVKAGLGMKADPAECQPLASLAGGTTSIEPVSLVHRSLEPTEAKNATVGSMWLASHSKKNAERVMKDLHTALKKCPKGFKTLGLTYQSVKQLDEPDLGDEAVVYRLTNVVGKQSMPMTFTVVRKGGLIAAFYGVNMLDEKNSRIPQPVVEAQLEQL
ncbi:hypothetical protein [Streptomyces sp. NPDC093260]|uniref:hypothetical protein n=1 Tax=Streptomyces sp. NPDC093260 TaxID=3155073 RepID=UPI003413D4D2